MTTKAIYFDMDGTIADLYGIENWLEKLRTFDPTPYEQAKPLLRLQPLARVLNTLQKKGYTIGIISWLSIGSTPEYSDAVAKAKTEWLKAHLKSVQFDEIHITAYGVPKPSCAECPLGILFDDNESIRNSWQGKAYEPANIMDILKALV